MQKAIACSNEKERLEALIALGVLDTPPEPCFDEITAMAAHVCNTPMALVSLVDEKRQWFKSKKGLDASETSRDISFCGHAIHDEEIFIVEDALKDERFCDNPLVCNVPNVRFYAGVPLWLTNGCAIGTLCVIDHVPRLLTQAQIETLKFLASQVVRHLESRWKNLLLSDQLIYTSKLAVLGEMTACVAHEINTPLGILSAKIEVLTHKQKIGVLKEALLLQELEKMHKTTERIAEIIKGLARFSRGSHRDGLVRYSLQQIVFETLELCENKLKKEKVDLSLEFERDCIVDCRPVEISQILLNLIMNAVYAVKNHEQRWITLRLFLQADQVHLQVVDSGSGISETVVNQMMTPFFTTKPVGVGTGLGLSISRGLAEEHGGRLSYEKWQGHTSFKLSLPVAQFQQKSA